MRTLQIRNGLSLALFTAALLALPAAAQQAPRIAAVVNAASYDSSAVSPATVVVLYGENLGPPEMAGMQLNEDGLVDHTLADTRVLFDGVPAPLLYASASQVAAVAPYSLAPGGAATVHAEYRGVRSDPFVVSTAPASPGIFTLDASGRGGAAAWSDSGIINAPGEPVAAGSVMAFYITGAGRTDPPGVDGKPASDPYPALAEAVTVTIGGAEAAVEYAGAAPGMVAGISQINVRVPDEAVSGDHVFLTVRVGERQSQAGVTVAVAGTSRTLPEPPLSFETTPSPGRVRLSWTGPEPGSILRARLERSAAAEGGYAEIAAVPASESAHIDNTVASQTTYYYRVRFETAEGYSRYSSPASVTTPYQPAAPANLRAAPAGSGNVRLEWSHQSPGEIVRIERRTSSGGYFEIGAVAASAGSFLDRNVSPATRYTYRVRADAAGALSAWSAEAAADTTPFGAGAGPPHIHPSDGRRLHWNGAAWYPVGYYPSVGALTSDQTDYVTFYKTLIDRLADTHINLMRAVFTMGQPYGDSMTVYQRTGPGVAADGRPKFDLTKFNQTYFDYWRNVATYANSKGIVLQLCIVDLWHNRATVVAEEGPLKTWGMRYDFYHGENNINGVSTANQTEWMSENHAVFQYHQAMVRKLVDTMGDLPNIIWEVGNETGRTDWEIRIADIITAYERSKGLALRLVMPRDLPGHQLVGGQCAADPAEVHRLLVSDFSKNAPLLADNDCVNAGKAGDRRRRAWAALTAGAHISLFHFEITDRAVLDSQDSADGMRYLGYLRNFLVDLDVDLVGMRPSDNLVTNGWAYARPGQEYIVYLPSGGVTSVTGLPARYTAVWFDPRSARTRPAGAGPAFTAPDANDWVLYIREQK